MNGNYNETCVVDRKPLQYEEQVSQMLNLIDRLEDKVRHISLANDLRDGNTSKEIKPALNSMLDEVIERLTRAVNNIQN